MMEVGVLGCLNQNWGSSMVLLSMIFLIALNSWNRANLPLPCHKCSFSLTFVAKISSVCTHTSIFCINDTCTDRTYIQTYEGLVDHTDHTNVHK